MSLDKVKFGTKRKVGWTRILLFIVVLGGLSFGAGVIRNPAWLNLVERTPPSLELVELGEYIGLSAPPVVLRFADEGAGIAELDVELIGVPTNGEKEDEPSRKQLYNKQGSLGNGGEVKLSVNPLAVGVRRGEVVLRVEAVDSSWWNNRSAVEHRFKVDVDPPDLKVLTTQHNGRIGGALFTFYSVSGLSDGESSGVSVSGRFFPGYPLEVAGDESVHVAVFPLSNRFLEGEGKESLRLQAVATDSAGNRSVENLYQSIKPNSFKDQAMTLSRRFYQNMVARLMPKYVLESGEETSIGDSSSLEGPELVGHFQTINERLRALNVKKIVSMKEKTATKPLWDGAFIKPLPAKVTASFGEQRSYFLGKLEAGGSVHEGYDLAHTLNAEVKASNTGRVLYAGDLGIYGNAVIIDHGIGVQTLYGHLSKVSVEVAQPVKQGDLIGFTGATGLAGGDHLHFEIRVHGVPVNPQEWMDSNWLKTRYYQPYEKIKAAKEGVTVK